MLVMRYPVQTRPMGRTHRGHTMTKNSVRISLSGSMRAAAAV